MPRPTELLFLLLVLYAWAPESWCYPAGFGNRYIDNLKNRPHPSTTVPDYNSINNNQPSKREEFVSKGWGAGGMPFSVLYMYPHHNQPQNAKPSAVDNSEDNVHQYQPPKPEALVAPREINNLKDASSKTVLQVRGNQQYQHHQVPATGTGYYNRMTLRRPYSVIPQLFVSYGWGPLGRK